MNDLKPVLISLYNLRVLQRELGLRLGKLKHDEEQMHRLCDLTGLIHSEPVPSCDELRVRAQVFAACKA